MEALLWMLCLLVMMYCAKKGGLVISRPCLFVIRYVSKEVGYNGFSKAV